jgi:hypothetical protein
MTVMVDMQNTGDPSLKGDVVASVEHALAVCIANAAQDHQNPRRIPQRRSGAEVAVSRAPAGGQEVDHANSSLARSPEPLHDSVAGTDAGPGKGCAMTTQNASTSMGRGRDTLPLHPIPKTKPGRLHKRLDTPFCPAAASPRPRLSWGPTTTDG